MRLKHIITIALFATCGSTFSQNYFTADNNDNAPEGDHVYSDLQTCINAAEDGDIIHVIPSETNYGDIILNKGVHLVGAGMVSDIPNGLTSQIRTITFDASTADGASLNGIVVTLTAAHPVLLGISGNEVDTLRNVEIKNCRIPGIAQQANAPLKNMVIRNSVFGNMNHYEAYYRATVNFRTESGMTENLVIANNIISPMWNLYVGTQNCINAANQTQIKNNWLHGPTNRPAFWVLSDCLVSNNVFFGATPNSSSISSGNVFSNNISYGCTGSCNFPPPSTGGASNTGSGNLADTDPAAANVEVNTWWDFGFQLEVPDSSPVLNAGTDGTDIGIFGGEHPFNNYNHLRGTPYVHLLSIPGLIMENQDIQLDATFRSN